MHLSILRLHIFIGLGDDSLQNAKINVTEALDVEANPACGVFAQLRQQFRVPHGPLHQVNGDLSLSGIEANGLTISFPSAVILEVVAVVAEGSDVPELGFAPANAVSQGHQRAAILSGDCIQRRDVVFDGSKVKRNFIFP